MRRLAFAIALTTLAVTLIPAQQPGDPREIQTYDVRAVFPREVSPARYQQVEQHELQTLAEQGWELVSVTPYVYLNEERGGEGVHPKPVVTQTYPAYFFKRLRPVRGR